MSAILPYPKVLTATEWNKKKGLAAKIVTVPTKLGDALRETEKDYNDVDWQVIFKAPGKTLKEIDDQIYDISQGITAKYRVFQRTILDAKALALKVKADWAKNKLIPKDAKTYLDLVITNLDSFWTKIDHETQTTFFELKETRRGVANKNPDQVAENNKKMGGGVILGKGAAKGPVEVKLKLKTPPPNRRESETKESESTQ